MKYKKIHFVGIKGVGMTPLAIIAKEAGCIVTGSDIPEEFITDEPLHNAQIRVFSSFSAEHCIGADLVITTGAHGGFDNVEVQAAKQANIPVWTQGQAVGEFMQGKLFNKIFDGISVAGTHGKTTTTAMIATVLQEAGLQPSYIIGTSNSKPLESPGHFGKGKYFVAEADEYATEPKQDKTPKFLWQHPKIAVITNIEFDHPDVYPDIAAIEDAFLKFVNQLPRNGLLIACGDDRVVQQLLKKYPGQSISYGFLPTNTYTLSRVRVSGSQTFFWVDAQGSSLGEFAIGVSGEHNALNALATIVVGMQIGIPIDKLKKGLHAFLGTKRRLEYRGTLSSGALLYDDYAHHPTELKKTLRALKLRHPTEKIVGIFQPHTYSRTKKLFDDFITSFADVDTVIVSDIYASRREAQDSAINSLMLVEAMQKKHKDVHYLPSLADVVEYLNRLRFKHDTVIITLGAGDIYHIGDTLLS